MYDGWIMIDGCKGWMDGESNKCWMVEEYIFDGWLDDRQLIGRMVGWMDRHPNDGWTVGYMYY